MGRRPVEPQGLEKVSLKPVKKASKAEGGLLEGIVLKKVVRDDEGGGSGSESRRGSMFNAAQEQFIRRGSERRDSIVSITF